MARLIASCVIPHLRIMVQLCQVSNMDGLVFTCRIGILPQTTFQVSQFTLQEALSPLYRLRLKVVSSRDDIPLNEQLGLRVTDTGIHHAKTRIRL